MGLQHDDNKGPLQTLLIFDQEVLKKLELPLAKGTHKHALFEFASDSLGADQILVGLDWNDGEVNTILVANRINLLINLIVLSAFERNGSGQEDFFAVVVELVV